MDTVFQCRLSHIYIWYFVHIKKAKENKKGKNKTDPDTMGDNTFHAVNHKECIPHCQPLPK